MMFESARLFFAERRGCSVQQLPVYETFVCGSLGGLGLWAPFYPLDVIKSTIMGDNYLKHQRKHSGIVETARSIYQAGGVPAFYRGFTPCVMRALVASAANLFTVFQLQNIGFPFGWGCE